MILVLIYLILLTSQRCCSQENSTKASEKGSGATTARTDTSTTFSTTVNFDNSSVTGGTRFTIISATVNTTSNGIIFETSTTRSQAGEQATSNTSTTFSTTVNFDNSSVTEGTGFTNISATVNTTSNGIMFETSTTRSQADEQATSTLEEGSSYTTPGSDVSPPFLTTVQSINDSTTEPSTFTDIDITKKSTAGVTATETTTMPSSTEEQMTSAPCLATCEGCFECQTINSLCQCTCIDGYTHDSGTICKPIRCTEVTVEAPSDSQPVTFPSTQAGFSTTSETTCGESTVNAGTPYGSRLCLVDGTWGRITWLSSCDTTLESVSNITVNSTQKERQQAANDVEIITSQPNSLDAANISSTVVILENIVNTTDLSEETADSVVQTVGNLLSAPEAELQESNQSQAILATLDTVAENVNLTEGESYESVSSAVAVSVMQLPSDSISQDIGFSYLALTTPTNLGFRVDQLSLFTNIPQEGNYTSFIYVPADAIKQSPENRVGFYGFFNDTLFYSPTQTSGECVSSEVILSASVVGKNVVDNLANPVVLHFSLNEQVTWNKTNGEISCVFWNESRQFWSSFEGKTNISNGSAQCEFNHLTNFATLFMPGSDDNDAGLYWVSVIGCSISTACLVLLIITYIFVRSSSRGTRFRSAFLLINLSLALLFLNILLILSEQEFVTESPGGCLAVSILLHFFLLSAIAWMMVEAGNIYMAVVHALYTKAFFTNRKVIITACLWGWLMPAVFVAIVLGVDIKAYTRQDNECWISEDLILYLVVIPCAIMLGINLVLYVVTTVKFTCGRLQGHKKASRKSSDKIKNVIVSWTLFITTGGTWIFGFLVFALELYPQQQIVFSYIFTILNSLQGLFLFLMYVVRQGLLSVLVKKLTSALSQSRERTEGKTSTTSNGGTQQQQNGGLESSAFTVKPYKRKRIGGLKKTYTVNHVEMNLFETSKTRQNFDSHFSFAYLSDVGFGCAENVHNDFADESRCNNQQSQCYEGEIHHSENYDNEIPSEIKTKSNATTPTNVQRFSRLEEKEE